MTHILECRRAPTNESILEHFGERYILKPLNRFDSPSGSEEISAG